MHDDVDRSLLDRLHALRGASATPDRTQPASPQYAAPHRPSAWALCPGRQQLTHAHRIGTDVIERAGTPTREEALAERLRSLRQHTPTSPSLPPAPGAASSPGSTPDRARATAVRRELATRHGAGVDDDAEAALQTDDATLEELLGRVDTLPPPLPLQLPGEPREERVRALLEELSQSVPKDDGGEDDVGIRAPSGGHGHASDSDDSEGENMGREVDQALARLRDELEVEAAGLGLGEDEAREPGPTQTPPPPPTSASRDEEPDDGSGLTLPSVPGSRPDDACSGAARFSTLDDLTARMAALRAPSHAPSSSTPPLPSVPTSKPTAASPGAARRLETTTRYTDDDADSWCVVCLEDATLRCLGCDDDAYCLGCWHDMHLGPAAGFDERSHRAVQLSRRQKRGERRVALGAS